MTEQEIERTLDELDKTETHCRQVLQTSRNPDERARAADALEYIARRRAQVLEEQRGLHVSRALRR